MEERNKNIKVVLCGSTSVGKTTVFCQLKGDKNITNPQTTVSAGFTHVDCEVNGKKVSFNVWDTAGLEAYRSITKIYYRGLHIAVILFDITSKSSFSDLAMWIEEINNNKHVDHYHLVIVGNKVDFVDRRAVTMEECNAFAESRNAHYFEISAYDKSQVDSLIQSIAGIWLNEASFVPSTQIKEDKIPIPDACIPPQSTELPPPIEVSVEEKPKPLDKPEVVNLIPEQVPQQTSGCC